MTTLSETRPPIVLPKADPATPGLDPGRIARLSEIIEAHIAAGRYPGAQIALARHRRLALHRTLGTSRLEPAAVPADERTLWRLNSQTKVLTAATVGTLVDRGALRFADRIADHMPEFARHGKDESTLSEVLTHQGGFPDAAVRPVCAPP